MAGVEADGRHGVWGITQGECMVRGFSGSLMPGPGTGLVVAESLLGLKLSADISRLAP